MKTVAIIEGFAGGPRHTRLFRRALEEAGFTVTKNRHTADAIFAHSAGIYAIPKDNQAELIVLVGPTYWPGKRLFERALLFAKQGNKYYLSRYGLKFFLRKKLLEWLYFFTRNKYLWLGIWHNNKMSSLERLFSSSKVIVVRNTDDAYTGPMIEKELKKYQNVKYVQLPGIHDDFTVNPKPYIKLLGGVK